MKVTYELKDGRKQIMKDVGMVYKDEDKLMLVETIDDNTGKLISEIDMENFIKIEND